MTFIFNLWYHIFTTYYFLTYYLKSFFLFWLSYLNSPDQYWATFDPPDMEAALADGSFDDPEDKRRLEEVFRKITQDLQILEKEIVLPRVLNETRGGFAELQQSLVTTLNPILTWDWIMVYSVEAYKELAKLLWLAEMWALPNLPAPKELRPGKGTVNYRYKLTSDWTTLNAEVIEPWILDISDERQILKVIEDREWDIPDWFAEKVIAYVDPAHTLDLSDIIYDYNWQLTFSKRELGSMISNWLFDSDQAIKGQLAVARNELAVARNESEWDKVRFIPSTSEIQLITSNEIEVDSSARAVLRGEKRKLEAELTKQKGQALADYKDCQRSLIDWELVLVSTYLTLQNLDSTIAAVQATITQINAEITRLQWIIWALNSLEEKAPFERKVRVLQKQLDALNKWRISVVKKTDPVTWIEYDAVTFSKTSFTDDINGWLNWLLAKKVEYDTLFNNKYSPFVHVNVKDFMNNYWDIVTAQDALWLWELPLMKFKRGMIIKDYKEKQMKTKKERKELLSLWDESINMAQLWKLKWELWELADIAEELVELSSQIDYVNVAIWWETDLAKKAKLELLKVSLIAVQSRYQTRRDVMLSDLQRELDWMVDVDSWFPVIVLQPLYNLYFNALVDEQNLVDSTPRLRYSQHLSAPSSSSSRPWSSVRSSWSGWKSSKRPIIRRRAKRSEPKDPCEGVPTIVDCLF